MTTNNDPRLLLSNLAIHVGPLFNESNVDDFKKHLNDVISGGERSIVKRIGTIYAFWSNIDVKFADSAVADSDTLPFMILLRDYKFAIVSELAHLCPIAVTMDTGKECRIASQADFEVFKELIGVVDKQVWRDKLTDKKLIDY